MEGKCMNRKKRIIFCGDFKYPRGGPSANYTQYFAKALTEMGHQVDIVCEINREYSNSKILEYQGSTVYNFLNDSNNYIIKRFMRGPFRKYSMYRVLKKMNIGSDDILVPTTYINTNILKTKSNLKCKSAGIPLEWFAKEDFELEKKYNKFKKSFELNKKHDLLFPISHNIARQFPNNKSMVLPIMADVGESVFKEKKQGKYKIIFPANGRMKDAIDNMLKAVAMLSEKDTSNIEFHITGVKKDVIKSYLTENEYNNIKSCLSVHGWMKYDELIALYQDVHYMFLAREINQMTLSNFPSKVPEVMAYGVVPIASRVGDYTKYYLEDGKDSIIFDGCSADNCLNALEKAISIPFEEYTIMSKNARKCVENKFDYKNWKEKISNMIEEI